MRQAQTLSLMRDMNRDDVVMPVTIPLALESELLIELPASAQAS
jgi:hypothetical protein